MVYGVSVRCFLAFHFLQAQPDPYYIVPSKQIKMIRTYRSFQVSYDQQLPKHRDHVFGPKIYRWRCGRFGGPTFNIEPSQQVDVQILLVGLLMSSDWKLCLWGFSFILSFRVLWLKNVWATLITHYSYIYMYIYLYVYINKHLFIYIYMTWNLDSETEFLKWKPDCTSALGNTPPTSFLMEKTNVEIKFIETGISSYMALNHCFQLKFSKHRLSCLAICFSGAF